MREIVQLLRERTGQGLLTFVIKINARREDPINEQPDRRADMGRDSENIRWSLPTNTDSSSLRLGLKMRENIKAL